MVVLEAVDRECALAFHRRVNEPPKFKWKALIIVLVGMLIIFIGVAVSAGDIKKFGYFVKVGGPASCLVLLNGFSIIGNAWFGKMNTQMMMMMSSSTSQLHTPPSIAAALASRLRFLLVAHLILFHQVRVESCFLKSVVGLAENGVELTHPAGPVLGRVALHEQAVAITYAVRKWFTITSVRCPPLKSLACLRLPRRACCSRRLMS